MISGNEPNDAPTKMEKRMNETKFVPVDFAVGQHPRAIPGDEGDGAEQGENDE